MHLLVNNNHVCAYFNTNLVNEARELLETHIEYTLGIYIQEHTYVYIIMMLHMDTYYGHTYLSQLNNNNTNMKHRT